MKRFASVLLLLLAACGQNEDHPWLGYAEGEDAFIAAPQAGWLAHVNVHRGDQVKTGDVLFTLDNSNQTATRDQAEAAIALAEKQRAAAEANLALAQKELVRQANLLRLNAGTKQAYDVAKANYDANVAQVGQIDAQIANARAGLSGAAYQLAQRDVTSRTTGRVEDVYFRTGEYAPAMTPVVSVLPPENVYVRFFVPETEFAHVKLGQRVSIKCDGCAHNIAATVTFIAQQEEFTPPVIFSQDNRAKLVFKIEARAPGGLRLNPGQPVEVRPL
ncbi:MAG: efflux RND transporter periplasmic adaptor subunit [Alphaproteobacteria bacterium]|nr:efflux RND transporter periplasmic adaptor subunit [Alphaproteobacteria bacterium]MBL7099764.1 efflux RND transporter periplasmic adaptor subunit [Alphaproteobacteria bacterium]